MTMKLMIILTVVILFIIAFAIYAVKAAGSRNEAGTKTCVKSKKYGDVLQKKKMCSGCKTGMDSYTLDPHSEACPYIGCWENGRCQFFVPLEKPSKAIKNKKTPIC